MFIDAWLGLCTAVSPGACTELATAAYARQPISFSVPRNGVARNSMPFSFGFGLGSIAGRAIYSAPAGGELLLVLPFASPYGYGSQADAWDAGSFCLQFNDFLGDPTGASLVRKYAAGQLIGTCWTDPRDFVGYTPALSPAGVTIPGGPQKVFVTGIITTGDPITISRGVLSSSAAVS